MTLLTQSKIILENIRKFIPIDMNVKESFLKGIMEGLKDIEDTLEREKENKK